MDLFKDPVANLIQNILFRSWQQMVILSGFNWAIVLGIG
jgi:hypothetical protein